MNACASSYYLQSGWEKAYKSKSYPDWRTAIIEYTVALKNKEKNPLFIYYARGLAYLKTGEYEKAEEDFNKSLKNYRVHNGDRVWEDQIRGNQVGTIYAYSAADRDLIADYLEGNAYNRIAEEWYLCGEYDRAFFYYNKMLRFNPNNERALNGLGKTNIAVNNNHMNHAGSIPSPAATNVQDTAPDKKMASLNYDKIEDGIFRVPLNKPFEDAWEEKIVLDKNCIFISRAFVDRIPYNSSIIGLKTNEKGRLFLFILNDRTFIPSVGDDIYIGWVFYETEEIDDGISIMFSAANGFASRGFLISNNTPLIKAIARSESELMTKLRARIR